MLHRTKTTTYRKPTPPPIILLRANDNSKTQRLTDFLNTKITARSRRRRRRRASDTVLHIPADEAIAPFPALESRSGVNSISNRISGRSQNAFSLICAVTLLVLSTTCSLCAGSPCDSHSWWDSVRDNCIPCTTCQGELIPLRPCQLHRDTICGSIYDLKIDWVVLAKTEPNWKERRKSDVSDFNSLEEQLTHEELQQFHEENREENFSLDWQTVALFMAVLACLLFFIVAACILIHHMREWRRMERRLDQDVEELSTKLMAKLAEVQSLEGGTFFIGHADALRATSTFQPQHVLIPKKHGNHIDRRFMKTFQTGNVYIEENSSKG